MTSAVTIIVCSVFVILGLWHFYMAVSGFSGESAAVPSQHGKPIFVPSAATSVAVGITLLLFAALVLATSGVLSLGIPQNVLSWFSNGLALGLFARAVGEFKYVGFFKKVRGSRFARMDTWVYSPLCLLLSAGVVFVAFS
jgi:high-affinity Fe2+/Pb2+ permease